jgi:acyl carrier protein
MTGQDIQTVIREELGNVAPEADINAVDRSADLRETLDIDSMDFLNFITAVHRRLGIEIPEKDYPKLFTLEGAIKYLESKRG